MLPALSLIILVLLIGVIALIVLYLNARKGENVGFAMAEEARQKYIADIKHLQVQIDNKAGEKFQLWRQNECEQIRKQEQEIAVQQANVQLQEWVYNSEISIRNDAIQRSQSVIIGKVTEHLLPYMADFPYNPKDVKFLGSPIDLIVFDGMDEGDIKQIVMLEVKTGDSASLSTRQRQIRNVVADGKIHWQEMRIKRS